MERKELSRLIRVTLSDHSATARDSHSEKIEEQVEELEKDLSSIRVHLNALLLKESDARLNESFWPSYLKEKDKPAITVGEDCLSCVTHKHKQYPDMKVTPGTVSMFIGDRHRSLIALDYKRIAEAWHKSRKGLNKKGRKVHA